MAQRTVLPSRALLGIVSKQCLVSKHTSWKLAVGSKICVYLRMQRKPYPVQLWYVCFLVFEKELPRLLALLFEYHAMQGGDFLRSRVCIALYNPKFSQLGYLGSLEAWGGGREGYELRRIRAVPPLRFNSACVQT